MPNNSNQYVVGLETLNGITDMVRRRLAKGVAECGVIVSQAAQQNAVKHIGDHIHVGEVKEEGNKTSVEVYVPISEAPDAGAWEYGSGLHRTKGTPGLYPIAAKNVPNLVFWWEKRSKWFVGPALPFGHPGIVARPYLRPALWDNVQRILEIMKKAVSGELYG